MWGYGRYGDDQLLPLSFDDIAHDTAAAMAAVSALGLPDRSIVIVTSTVADVGYFHPLQVAAKELGLLVCNADASAMDVDRVEMFARLLTVAAVIGVNDALVDGILERGHDPKSFFSSVPMVIASSGRQGPACGIRGGRAGVRVPGPGHGAVVPPPESACRRSPVVPQRRRGHPPCLEPGPAGPPLRPFRYRDCRAASPTMSVPVGVAIPSSTIERARQAESVGDGCTRGRPRPRCRPCSMSTRAADPKVWRWCAARSA